MLRNRVRSARTLAALIAVAAPVEGLPAESHDAKPVQVYIRSGQSNMVGIGQVTGGGGR